MSSPRVLVFDQDSAHCSECCDVLKSAGFEPVVLWDRHRLSATLEEQSPVAALIEPDGLPDGGLMLEQLRGAGIPVFAVVSMWLGPMNRALGLTYDGCAEVFEKPVADSELRTWLRRLFPEVKAVPTTVAATEPFAKTGPPDRTFVEHVGSPALRADVHTRETGPVDVVAVELQLMAESTRVAPAASLASPPGASVRQTPVSGTLTVPVPRALDVQQVEPSGEFADAYFPTILASLAYRRATGSLMLQQGDDKRLAYFEQGFVVGVKTNQPDDTLTESMVSQGLITLDQRMQVERHAQSARISASQSLVELQLLPKDDVDTIVSAHLRNRLMDVFEWTHGQYTFRDSNVPRGYQHDPVVSPMDFIWQGVQFSTPISIIRETLQPCATYRMAWVSEPPPADVMDLTQSQRAFFADVEKHQKLDDLRTQGRLNEAVWRVAFVLAACGFVQFTPA